VIEWSVRIDTTLRIPQLAKPSRRVDAVNRAAAGVATMIETGRVQYTTLIPEPNISQENVREQNYYSIRGIRICHDLRVCAVPAASDG
jgi:hypothetical protein